ncbi:MAG: cyclodeaminase/cyclohydrolase family protein, partial [Planctomycetota bacterium]
EEYGVAQISMNLTNISVTPVHVAFDAVCERAQARGARVTGSELVGLIPLNAMLDAGRHYLRKQNRSLGVSDKELIKIAVKSLGLDDLYEFKPQEKIIEYAIAADRKQRQLVDMPLSDFMWETASESKAPGGGSVSAYVGALGASLATMVSNLSSHKRGWDDRWEEYSDWAVKGKVCHDELLRLVDEDTIAFNKIMAAFGLPESTDEEKAAKNKAIQDATVGATEVPFRTMEVAFQSMEVAEAMAHSGLEASVSDAGVAAVCARSAVMGAFLNVRINAAELEDQAVKDDFLKRGAELQRKTMDKETQILRIVDEKM